MKYSNTDYVTGLSITFEPVSSTIMSDLREIVNNFLDENGLELESYQIEFMVDNRTLDMFESP